MSEKNNNNQMVNSSPNSQNQNQPQAVMVGVAIPVANNQGNSIKNQIILKSTPAFVICPKCGYNGLTITLTTCNASNCLCCLATSPISWCFFQLVRGKDLNCNDAIHVCPRCHAGLGIYHAC